MRISSNAIFFVILSYFITNEIEAFAKLKILERRDLENPGKITRHCYLEGAYFGKFPVVFEKTKRFKFDFAPDGKFPLLFVKEDELGSSNRPYFSTKATFFSESKRDRSETCDWQYNEFYSESNLSSMEANQNEVGIHRLEEVGFPFTGFMVSVLVHLSLGKLKDGPVRAYISREIDIPGLTLFGENIDPARVNRFSDSLILEIKEETLNKDDLAP